MGSTVVFGDYASMGVGGSDWHQEKTRISR